MDLEELRTVRATERGKDSLQHLRDSFYEEVADYLADLRERREQAAAATDRPYQDEEVRRLTDEIEAAEDVAEALYERRVGKVVKMASFAAADMPVEADGLTARERELFEDLVERIEANKESVIESLAGESALDDDGDGPNVTGPFDDDGGDAEDRSSGQTAAGASDRADEPAADGTRDGPDRTDRDAGSSADASPGDADDLLADAMATGGGGGQGGSAAGDSGPVADAGAGSVEDREDPASEPATTPDADGPDRTTVRVTDDVGEILGVDDRAYDLAVDDVVTLPAENAEPLIERDAAERID